MQFKFDIKRTAPQVSSLEPASGKVYIFVEPFPELFEVLTEGKPDECDGARCVSFVLDNDLAYNQSMALTVGIINQEAEDIE